MSWAAWLLHCSAHESSRQGWWYDWFGTSNNLGHKFKVWCLILFDPFLKSWAYDKLISDLGKIPIYPGGSLFAQLFDVICFFGRACGSVACTNPEIILQIEATFLIWMLAASFKGHKVFQIVTSHPGKEQMRGKQRFCTLGGCLKFWFMCWCATYDMLWPYGHEMKPIAKWSLALHWM